MDISTSKKTFGTWKGKPVMEYTLCNKNGMQVSVINYGAITTKIITPDKNNSPANVIIGFNDLDSYIQNGNCYYGAIVGRYANRIANGIFTLDGTEYRLAKNDGNNSLHGGNKGFDKVWWEAEEPHANDSLTFTYLSKDGEEGFPGNLQVTVTYTLTAENALSIGYTAITDQSTPVNLTNHCYFNLTGRTAESILDHELKIFAGQYTAVNASLIPTGEIANVKNTALDFTLAKTIGKDIAAIGGYDHNMILDKKEADQSTGFSKAAVLYEPASGRSMEMFTTEPAVQFYSGNLKSGLGELAGLCLEAQHYPDSPNELSFPNTILRPGEEYRQTTVYKFSANQPF